MDHVCGRSPVRTHGATELKWQGVRSQVLKWKAKSGTKQTSHRLSRFPKEGLEIRGLSRLIWTPLKLVPPGTNLFEIYGPTLKNLFPLAIGQPHKRKSVTTKDVSGVHSCISRQMNDCFS